MSYQALSRSLAWIALIFALGAPTASGQRSGLWSSDGDAALYQELNLSKPQAERMTALRERVRNDTIQLRRQMEERRRELAALYAQYEFDERRAALLRQAIREIQAQLLELHHQFQIELRKILTPAQFERLQQALGRQRRGPHQRMRDGRRGSPHGMGRR